MATPQRLRPTLASEFWLIGPNPELQGPSPYPAGSPPECVDHHIFRGPDGCWHLWGCIRGVATGCILYHWEGESLEKGPWRQTGERMRPDPWWKERGRCGLSLPSRPVGEGLREGAILANGRGR